MREEEAARVARAKLDEITKALSQARERREAFIVEPYYLEFKRDAHG